MTAQISKVAERVICLMFTPYVELRQRYGPAQFAYTKRRGSRDAVLLMMMHWLSAFNDRRRVVLYCSDVAGAFDRVSATRLQEKLRAHGITPELVAVLVFWLRQPKARVVIAGDSSGEMTLGDMVYQGTVLGPQLWNLFFGDARDAIGLAEFLEMIYADDLDAFKISERGEDDESLFSKAAVCQVSLHAWGHANQVTFEASKESTHILSHTVPVGDNFKILGIMFDCRLRMGDAVDEVLSAVGWTVQMSMRVRRFYSVVELVGLYKAHILSFIEYRTPAIYHSISSVLVKIDKVQQRFLRELGLSELAALVHCQLAPLTSRRDMSMLGLIHRTVVGHGPKQFQKFIRPPWRYSLEVGWFEASRFSLARIRLDSQSRII